MFKEFKEFAMRGNVVDMAVGIVIGGAFGTIVKSLVDDVLMPPIGLLLGGVDFSDFFVVMNHIEWSIMNIAWLSAPLHYVLCTFLVFSANLTIVLW